MKSKKVDPVLYWLILVVIFLIYMVYKVIKGPFLSSLLWIGGIMVLGFATQQIYVEYKKFKKVENEKNEKIEQEKRKKREQEKKNERALFVENKKMELAKSRDDLLKELNSIQRNYQEESKRQNLHDPIIDSIISDDEVLAVNSPMAFEIGKDEDGDKQIIDFETISKLIIEGSLGSGKTSFVKKIIVQLMARSSPEELRIVLININSNDYRAFDDLPHLIGQIVTDKDTALETLFQLTKELERRYELIESSDSSEDGDYYETDINDLLPHIVVIFDDLGDFIAEAGVDITPPLLMLAKSGHYANIHVILTTSDVSNNEVTKELIKLRKELIVLKLASIKDFDNSLNQIGAGKLEKQGEMLFLEPKSDSLTQICCTVYNDSEIERICEYLRLQPLSKDKVTSNVSETRRAILIDYDDDLFPDAARIVVSANMASVSMLQRHFKIGQARARRLIEMLEKANIIGPQVGRKSREIIATNDDLEELGID